MIIFKTLYQKGKKSILRKFIQSLFLYILSRMSPKNFENHKLKIIGFIRKLVLFKTFIYRKLKSIFLKLKHPKYLKLPALHIISLDALIKFLRIFKEKKIDFFLVGGTLLGSIKHESFAGRPTDVDIGIKEEDLPELLSMLPLIKKMKTKYIKVWPVGGHERIQILFYGALIDIGVYRKKMIEKDLVWIGETEQPWDQVYDGITFPFNDLKNLVSTKLYDKTFYAPSNSKKYLLKKFGVNWTVIYKNQFLWKK